MRPATGKDYHERIVPTLVFIQQHLDDDLTLDEPVIGLALDAGFETHEAFTRAFKAMFGTSPSDYRAAHKPAPESPRGTHFEETGGYHPPDYGELPPVEVKEIPRVRVVFLRHVGPDGAAC